MRVCGRAAASYSQRDAAMESSHTLDLKRSSCFSRGEAPGLFPECPACLSFFSTVFTLTLCSGSCRQRAVASPQAFSLAAVRVRYHGNKAEPVTLFAVFIIPSLQPLGFSSSSSSIPYFVPSKTDRVSSCEKSKTISSSVFFPQAGHAPRHLYLPNP